MEEVMRAFLEFLGLVRPDPSRRDPVALPAWVRWVVPTLVVVLTLATTAIFVLLRSLR